MGSIFIYSGPSEVYCIKLEGRIHYWIKGFKKPGLYFSCLPGIGGRKCDYCLPGFHAFPLCRECDCDRYGTEEEICDVDTGYCLCKVSTIVLLGSMPSLYVGNVTMIDMVQRRRSVM